MDGDFFSQRGDQRGNSLIGFCMQDQFIFYFLFLLATSSQISKYLFFVYFMPLYCADVLQQNYLQHFYLRNARCLIHTKFLKAAHSVS